MGRAIDATGIQFKLLNSSRGPAVWSPRAQADKHLYSQWVRDLLRSQPAIEWLIGRAGSLIVRGGEVAGLELEDGRQFGCRALVVTTGTFLNGLIHIGPDQKPAGRADEPPSVDLAASLKSFGFNWGRLKTGTPPRLDRNSIDFAGAVERGVFHVEHGDAEPIPFSFATDDPRLNSTECWLLHTTEEVHRLVRSRIDSSPLFNGQIQGIGPRYCPSLEDKVMRFPEKDRHQLFLEPEGLASELIYVNGYSMSLPAETQAQLVRLLPGLETARVVRPGYAIEYDFIQPTELTASLEARRLPRLFLAGQINGTSGYEEAAGQGLVAGANAGARAVGRPTFRLRRDQAYVGIMVDDLITKGCLEPYRIFTSRAEYRLMLRIDNADLRLTPMAREAGLIDDMQWERFAARLGRYTRNVGHLRVAKVRLASGDRVPASQALKQPDVRLANLAKLGDVSVELTPNCAHLDSVSAETALKFEGYLLRQEQAIHRAKKHEQREIPSAFAYAGIPGLSTEMIQRFEQVRPANLGQALRIPGVTPAAVAVLGAYVERFVHERA